MNSSVEPKPFVKWVGGKRQLLPELFSRLPEKFNAYHEPFLGGGALFFGLAARRRLRRTLLSDGNAELIGTYLAIRDSVEEVIALLSKHPHDSEHYYRVRAMKPDALSLAERAARFIFLNRTGYNGLYRVNSRGEFNVPFGRYRNPKICDVENLRAVSAVLEGARIEVRHYSTALGKARKGDFVYFDPPYHPVSKTANFTSYAQGGFTEEDQRELRDIFATLARRGILVMLSNSDTPLVRELYREFRVERVLARRNVNSKASGRGKIGEVIVTAG